MREKIKAAIISYLEETGNYFTRDEDDASYDGGLNLEEFAKVIEEHIK